ncbi:hypothetical protein ACQB60_33425 [Actinomycetota bacterium Odt1-20B]
MGKARNIAEGTAALLAAGVIALNIHYASTTPTGHHYEAGLTLGLAIALSVALLRRFTHLPLGRTRPYAFQLPDPAPDWRAPVPDPRGDPESLRPYAETRAALLSNASALVDALHHSCALPDEERRRLQRMASAASVQASNAVVIQAEGGGDAAYVIGELTAAVEFARIGMRAVEALTAERPLVADPPCYFNPLHERGHARVDSPLAVDGATAQVAACRGCAAAGPAPLLVPTPDESGGAVRSTSLEGRRETGGWVPYYESEAVEPRWRLRGYGAVLPEDDGSAMLTAAHDGYRTDASKNPTEPRTKVG